MRTQEEIVERIKYLQANAFLFEFGSEVLLDYLDFEHAQGFLKDTVTAEMWEGRSYGDFAGYGPPSGRTCPIPASDRDFILAAMRHYAAFGWEKIEGQRGISAARTVQKMAAWLWLLEDEEMLEAAEDAGSYGARFLTQVCEKYSFPIPGGAEQDEEDDEEAENE